jgi:hypothetical protein
VILAWGRKEMVDGLDFRMFRYFVAADEERTLRTNRRAASAD